MVRNSLKYVTWKDRKSLAANLKEIYKASTAEEAKANLINFSEKWDKKYPAISKL